MSDRTVHFKEIKVQRVSGIGQGEGFTLTDLAPGVNLVHGPNGSGKSTTAKVIQELLWPGQTGLERPTVSGRFACDGYEWLIDVDAGQRTAMRDGKADAPPSSGGAEFRARYHLALHDLVRASEADSHFAATIARESQGGFDLEAAAAALGYNSNPSKPTRESKAVIEIYKKVDEATRLQSGIQSQEATLGSLRADRESTITAVQFITALEKVQEYHQCQRRYEELQVELDAMPPEIALLQGDERKQLDELRLQLEKWRNELASQQQHVKQANEEIRTCGLPLEPINDSAIVSIQVSHSELLKVESRCNQRQEDLNRANGEAENARNRISDHVTDQQLETLASLDADVRRQMDGFVQNVHQIRAERALLDLQRNHLDQPEPHEIQAFTLDQLKKGADAIGDWLSTPTSAIVPASGSGFTPPFITSVVLVGVLGIALAIVHHGAWALMTLAVAGIVMWQLRIRPERSHEVAGDAKAGNRDRYERIGLGAPSDWTVESVGSHLSNLFAMSAKRALADERAQWLRNLGKEEQALEAKQSQLSEQRVEIEKGLGLKIKVDDTWLSILIDNILRWQERTASAAGAKEVLESLTKHQGELLDQINQGMEPFGFERLHTVTAATQAIEDLQTRQRKYQLAQQRRLDAQGRIDELIQPALEEATGNRTVIYSKLGIDESQEFMLDKWLVSLKEFHELKKERDIAIRDRDKTTESLKGREDLLAMPPSEIQLKIEENKDLAARRDELTRSISRIEDAIAKAKVGYELAEALEARETRLTELADARDQRGESIVGAVMTDWLRTSAIEVSRPAVFQLAKKLLAQFSHGELDLEIDERTTPAEFLAGSPNGLKRPVDHLSIGERVQLLMAVRLAFLEHDESLRLPLLLDETLGTSDDIRAGIIIDSVIELAKMGRQVFYFTAQQDEVGKWISRLNAAGVDFKVTDLAQARKQSAVSARPLTIAPVEIVGLPRPDGLSYFEYGKALGVSAMDPWAHSLDQLHLWHLLQDSQVLHDMMSRHVSTWGQLQTLLKAGGADMFALDEEILDRVRTKAKVIEEAIRCWRIGRGKPVDRSVILASEVASDTFVDRLAELAQNCMSDAKQFLKCLENKDVLRWRAENTERFATYFEEHGYLSMEEPLTLDQLRIQVMAAIADLLRDGRVDQSQLDGILAELRP